MSKPRRFHSSPPQLPPYTLLPAAAGSTPTGGMVNPFTGPPSMWSFEVRRVASAKDIVQTVDAMPIARVLDTAESAPRNAEEAKRGGLVLYLLGRMGMFGEPQSEMKRADRTRKTSHPARGTKRKAAQAVQNPLQSYDSDTNDEDSDDDEEARQPSFTDA